MCVLEKNSRSVRVMAAACVSENRTTKRYQRGGSSLAAHDFGRSESSGGVAAR